MLGNTANQAAGFHPGVPLHLQVQRALGLHQQGQLDAAESLYTAILARHAKQTECLHYLGVIKYQQGRHQEAVDLIKKAINLDKNNPEAHSNLGLALHGNGRHQLALDSYARALALNPRHPDALNNRGNVHRDLNRLEQALSDYDSALALRPRFALALAARADVLNRLGRTQDALAAIDRALALQETPELHNARGTVLQTLQRRDDALLCFEAALRCDPTHLAAWNHKAGALYLMGRRDEALAALEQAASLAPQAADIRLKQAVVKLHIIRPADHDLAAERATFAQDLAAFDAWLPQQAVANPLAVVGGCHPFYLSYHEQNNRAPLAQYGAMCARLMGQWATQRGLPALASSASTAAPARKAGAAPIRVGVVSAHVVEHPVWRAIVRGWFSELDQQRFELHLYYLGGKEDGETAYARSRAAVMHQGTRSELEWAKLIAGANLDALIYPELGMDAMAPRLAALRLAPRQLATWGHPETTGLPTIDAYLSATGLESEDAQDHYLEQLVRLPNLGCHYEPPQVETVNLDLAALGVRPGVPLFVCPGSPFKYAPEYDHVLVDIAKRCGPCQFLFFSNVQASHLTDLLQARVAQAFAQAGLAPEQYLVSIPWQSPACFYSILRQADVFLDTLGFSGFNTAMQAVDCALPIVTVEGRFMRGRFGSAILRRMGLAHLVQADSAGYVDLACRLAADAALRDTVRAALAAQRDVLYRDAAPIRELERYLEQAVVA
ncbi:O-linked N-acetylglucosamine transferase, SPINDLY family protein [Rugamonas apoptosis]|uniref:protein O-GlcNAc transferase n=1 Tax=Rugamonas apoptosis TaxID=2758570 RepID=A0A7W2FBL0_9BURK|nr:glycosyltransferase family 41 protein [Rugamonas apoptosis]MBA5688640.1 tetratricopeptide repeat protein [Rugamonas apoptosis]